MTINRREFIKNNAIAAADAKNAPGATAKVQGAAAGSAAHPGFLDEVEALRVELAAAEPFHPGHAVAAAHAAIRERIPFLDRDRALDGEVAAAVALVADGSLLAAIGR